MLVSKLFPAARHDLGAAGGEGWRYLVVAEAEKGGGLRDVQIVLPVPRPDEFTRSILPFLSWAVWLAGQMYSTLPGRLKC